MWILCQIIVFHLCQIIHTLAPADFISPWYDIQAYDNPEVTISHELNELPLKVEVQIRVHDSGLNKHVYFLAMGSAQKGNDNIHQYGGVVYVYNNETIKILAPGPDGCTTSNCTGSLVYLGGSRFLGDNSITSTSYSSGSVRARVWKACTLPRPTYASPYDIPLSSLDDNFGSFAPDMTKPPSLVIVRCHTEDGWVFEAQGSVFYTNSSNPFGGVVFAYAKSQIRVWTPKRGTGDSPANGVPFNAMDGWGKSGNFGYSSTVRVRVFAWDFTSLKSNPIIESKTTYISNSFSLSVPAGYSHQSDNVLLILSVKAEVGENNDFEFIPSGSSMTDGTTNTHNAHFGTFIYGYTPDKVYFWLPNPQFAGCAILMGGLWGGGQYQQCVNEPNVVVKTTISLLNSTESACGDRGCLKATESGAQCNCTGSGMEGPFCTIGIRCYKPTDHRYAIPDPQQNSYPYNTSITFSCKIGYDYKKGSSSRTCMEDKTWNGTAYHCKPISCGMPDNGTFSYISSLSGTYFKDIVNYTCEDGYGELSGNSHRFCQSDKTWNGIALICKKTCFEEMLPEGVYRTNTGNFVHDTALFACKDGFTYVGGNESRECDINSTWSGEVFNCTRISCGMPPTITKGSVWYSSTLYESLAEYTCDIGYVDQYGRTNGSFTCLFTGNWLRQPNCQRVICQSPQYIANGSYNSSSEYKYGDMVAYTCDPTFNLIGIAERYCEASQYWSTPIPTCEVVSCPPLNVSNGVPYVSSYQYNGFASVACNDGFVYNGSYTPAFCLESGQWTDNQQQCINISQSSTVVSCPPLIVSNGVVYVSSYQYNGFALVACNEGFVYNGSYTPAFCLESGQWTDNQQQCIDISQSSTGNNHCPYNPPKTNVTDRSYLYKVDRKSTSNYRRTLISAGDDRQSAAITGWVGVMVLVLVFGFMVALDIANACHERNPSKKSDKKQEQ